MLLLIEETRLDYQVLGFTCLLLNLDVHVPRRLVDREKLLEHQHLFGVVECF